LNDFKKILLSSLIYVLFLSLLPSNLVGIQVKAESENLKEIKFDSSYYIMEAAQYKDSTFILGSKKEADDNYSGKVGISVLQDDHMNEIISATEIANRYTLLIGESTENLYFRSGDPWTGDKTYEYYIINKESLQYQSLSESEFLKDYHKALVSKGYDPSELYGYIMFNESGPSWVRYSYAGEDSEENYDVYVSANGVVHQPDEPWAQGEMVDNEGNLLYIDSVTSDIIKIDRYGNKQTLTFDGEEYLNGHMMIDSKGNFVIQTYSEDKNGYIVLHQEESYLKKLTFIPDVYHLTQDNSGRFWFETNELGSDTSTIVYGYYDDVNYEKHPLYSVKLDNDVDYGWFRFDVYNDTFMIYDDYKLGYNNKDPKPVVHKGWQKENGSWYFYKDGEKETGWVISDNEWYYLNSRGVMQTGWIKLDGTWYHLKSSGAMSAGWVKSEGKWYLLSESGAMLTGWAKSGGDWYFLNQDGAMQTGWINSGGIWYHLASSGEMTTGWFKEGSAWYFLNMSGEMEIGWREIGGKWYYFYASGKMAANTVIDGYKVNSNGAWIQ
jgi:glucan-binding YG repeat protein